MSLRRATTILLVRDGDLGLEVFLVQRHRRSGFLPNAWVFPGGRVDAADAGQQRVRGGESLVARMDLPRAEAVAHLVAGVRETFEEAGVWVGTGALPEHSRDPLARGELALSDLLERHDATIDLDGVGLWSWWVTPEAEPRRYDTRFLVAGVDGRIGRHDDSETVASGWFRPSEIITRSIADFPMAPPTWWTLRELAPFDTRAEVLAEARVRPHRPVMPVMRFSDGGMDLLLPGHADHPEAAIPGVPYHIAYVDGHWVAYRGGRAV
ncbi:MAG: 8-oxo-dGTP pyrophosphatase MutT (NUDIX family) [Myxococcota bacterium]